MRGMCPNMDYALHVLQDVLNPYKVIVFFIDCLLSPVMPSMDT
jgi:hypothetical protein